ncbi:hypothetical protein BGX38DRAFT_1090129 [Terfezia claveryi]|nr:hypothetical protein BGX38DRAFT_1090129 [Terfezia claveryi]
MADQFDSYRTQFYCALCGGPFARVFRTAAEAASPKDPATASNASADCTNQNSGLRLSPVSGAADPDDRDLTNGFNIPVEENHVIPEEVVLDNMGYAASRHRDHRIRVSEKGLRRGIMSENRRTFKAYDGRRISTKQMQWTRDLRALIHKKAKDFPIGGQQYLRDGRSQFLTGRGRIRQVGAWADASASYELEDELRVDTGSPYGFQVYQEFGRLDSEFVISSIPFHEQCWDLLVYATEVSARERGVDMHYDPIDENEDILWGYLRGLVGISGVAKWLGSGTVSTLHGSRRGEVITRLGEVDYREAQGSGEGFQWRHDEGLHWIVADPDASATRIFADPLVMSDNAAISILTNISLGTSLDWTKHRRAYSDPFYFLPPEIKVEVFRYLTSTDIFSFKQASLSVHSVEIPSLMYKRFIQEEFDYYPPLTTAVKRYVEGSLSLAKNVKVDWKATFERARKSIRTPEPGDGSEWDEIDINLKNRNRIWKIVKPMAEEFVETCPSVLRQKYGVPVQQANRTSVVRGWVGTRSGREGVAESAYFGDRARPREKTAEAEDEDEDEDDDDDDDSDEVDDETISTELVKVRVYLSKGSQIVCGLGFLIYDEEEEEMQIRRFGRRSFQCEDIQIPTHKNLIGFVFCFTENVVSGIRLVFGDPRHSPHSTISEFSAPIGKWGGVMRKVIAPPDYRMLAGVTGFINSSGFIEKIGLLELTLERRTSDQFGIIPVAPLQVALSHEESSVWKILPPTNVRCLEREGPKIRNWKLHMAEWEVWQPGYEGEGILSLPSPRPKSLCEIVGYYDNEFLRGLSFIYETPFGRIVSTAGVNVAKCKSTFPMSIGERVSAVVISFGVGGVHGLLFVTDRGRKSDVLGPRYAGTHKIFGPLLTGPLSTAHRYDLQGVDAVVGLHYLYDNEAQRFLQLGLIVPMEENSVSLQQNLPPIPFDQIDGDSLQWEDGPPPQDLVVSREAGTLLADNDTGSTFTGWVDLLPGLQQILTYGQMKGIRFVYSDSNRRDKYFGNAEGIISGPYIQDIDGIQGEKVIGLYEIFEEESATEDESRMTMSFDDVATVSDTSGYDGPGLMPRLWFLTDRNQDKRPLHCHKIIDADGLRGMKFNFTADGIQAWLPIYSGASGEHETRFPWYHRGFHADRPLSPACSVTHEYFEDIAGREVDAVKGYINRDGSFCGLLFRRGGEWSESVFGEMSAFEITMELGKGEVICSAYTSGTTALALVTSKGKCTPWFGEVKQDPEWRGPARHKVAVGIYGAVEKASKLVDRITWKELGLLYGEAASSRRCKHRRQDSSIPLALQFPEIDPQTTLPWYSDIRNKRSNYELAEMVGQKEPTYWNGKSFWRGYMAYDPAELEQIRVFVNRHVALRGIRALRLRGTKRMGVTTMGVWMNNRDYIVRKSGKMKIRGPAGEKITTVNVHLRCAETEVMVGSAQESVVGLEISTTSGKQKRMFGCVYPHSELCGQVVTKQLVCRDGYEVVGFHGVFCVREIPQYCTYTILMPQIIVGPLSTRYRTGFVPDYSTDSLP